MINKKFTTNKALACYLEISILILASFAFAYVLNDNKLLYENNEVGVFGKIKGFIMSQIEKPMFPLASAQTATVTPFSSTVCCEKTNYGAWCQNSKEENCNNAFRKNPTSCDATSFCRQGCCYDSKEGTCSENTPQLVCQASNGTWADSADCSIKQCNLGCCVLGNQAAFATLVSCKKLSAFYGLQTDFRTDVKSESACINIAQSQDRGACVFEQDFVRTCKFTTRKECDTLTRKIMGNVTTSNFTFYKDNLCSDEELGTNCGPTEKTTCIEGKDEVYFLDSCGNTANIYDASKVNDKNYWKKVIDKSKSCGASSSLGNANSASCGNCDYFAGSFCRNYDKSKDISRPTYGNFVCRDLNCKSTSDGKNYKHGESWCVYDAKTGSGLDPAGSRAFKHICIAGEELVEPCADFRAETCIQDKITTDKGAFQQAGCRANRWQDCVAQKEKDKCLNTDKRDCNWIEGVVGKDALGGSNTTINSKVNKDKEVKELKPHGVCVPDVPPGLKFYSSGEAEGICSMGNSVCEVGYEKGLFGEKKCVTNCECLSNSWTQKRQEICQSLGDCSGDKKTCDNGKCTVKAGMWQYLPNSKPVSGTGMKIVASLANLFSYFIGIGMGSAQSPPPSPPAGQLTESEIAALRAGKTLPLPSGTGGTGTPLNPAEWAASKTPGVGGVISPNNQIQYVGGKYYGLNPSTNRYDLSLDASGKPVSGAGGGSTDLLSSIMGDTIIGSLMWAVAAGGIVYFAAGLFGANKNLQEALGLGVFAGVLSYNLINPLLTGAGYHGVLGGMLAGKVPMFAAMGPGAGVPLGTVAAGQLASLGIGIGIGFLVFAMMYKKTSVEVVKFSCKSYEAPTGGQFCESCNKDLFRPCSEYRCKSLGQACELLNAGTGKEACAWVNPKDVASPTIVPWTDPLTKDHSYRDVKTRPPGTGFKIARTASSDGCIRAFTPLIFGIQTNEPAQCKIDYNNTVNVRTVKEAYDSMAYYFGETNIYSYNHSQTLRLPGPAALAAQNISPEIGIDGTFTLYVRCQDANGNVNEDEFAIRFCVEKGPDTTPPRIEGTNIPNNMPITFNTNSTDIELYVNEPSTCRFSKQDKDYSLMENEMECDANVWDINNNMLYKCFGNLRGLENRKDNAFYFRCRDKPYSPESERNVNTESYAFTLKGTQPLNIVSVAPNGTLQGYADIVPVTLEVETANGYHNGDSLCYYSQANTDASYIKMFDTGTNLHKQRQDLPAGTYNYYFKCVDLGGNADYKSISFTIEIDRTAPKVTRIYNEGGNLKVETDEKSTCYYSENLNTGCNFALSEGKSMLYQNVTAHYIEWKANKNLFIKCVDTSGNQPNPADCSITARAYNSAEK